VPVLKRRDRNSGQAQGSRGDPVARHLTTSTARQPLAAAEAALRWSTRTKKRARCGDRPYWPRETCPPLGARIQQARRVHLGFSLGCRHHAKTRTSAAAPIAGVKRLQTVLPGIPTKRPWTVGFSGRPTSKRTGGSQPVPAGCLVPRTAGERVAGLLRSGHVVPTGACHRRVGSHHKCSARKPTFVFVLSSTGQTLFLFTDPIE